MKITIQAKIDKAATKELPVVTPVLMRNSDGATVVVIRGFSEALSFDPRDGSICHGEHDYYSKNWTLIREFNSSDSLTIKGGSHD